MSQINNSKKKKKKIKINNKYTQRTTLVSMRLIWVHGPNFNGSNTDLLRTHKPVEGWKINCCVSFW